MMIRSEVLEKIRSLQAEQLRLHTQRQALWDKIYNMHFSREVARISNDISLPGTSAYAGRVATDAVQYITEESNRCYKEIKHLEELL